jgi:hypothetical protein
MKRLMQMLALGLMALVFAVPGFARANSEHRITSVQEGQDEDAKNDLYTIVRENVNSAKDQPKAYQAAKEYLRKWPTDDDAIARYLKDFVAKYEKAIRRQDCTKLIGEKKWADAFSLCKQVTNDNADDLASNLNLSWAGMQLVVTGNSTNNVEAARAAQTTIQMIDSGKTIEPGKPYPEKDKQESLGWLNYSLGLYHEKGEKFADAAAAFIKSAGYESSLKSNPATYTKLASVYESEYGRLQVSYDAVYKGQTETEESKAALLQIKQFLDPLIDAYARAVAYSGESASNQQIKTAAKQRLTELYKFAKGSEDGIDALIAGVKMKPIPPHPNTTMTMPAAPATTSTPTTGSGTVASEPNAGATTSASSATPAKGTTTKSNAVQNGTQEKKPVTAPAGNNGRRPRRK